MHVHKLIEMLSYVLFGAPTYKKFLSKSFQYEIEIYFFVICVVAIKNRRCVSVEAYLSTFFLFAKAGAAILFYKMNIQLSIWYIVLCIGK